MKMTEGYHVAIMQREVIENMPFENAGVYVDGTLGGGGHAGLIFDNMAAGSVLYGIDRDAEAIAEASKKISSTESKRFCALRGNFFNMRSLLNENGVKQVDGILLDLGISSHQLDVAERGFSYMQEARLDMRMDRDAPLTAYDIVNYYEEAELTRIFREYGEERYSGRIARRIVERRKNAPIQTTLELVDCIKSAMPRQAFAEKQHPAKRTFQAIRIETNGELYGLENALEAAIELLKVGGVIEVITFHSLEEKAVKNVYSKLRRGCICDPKAPICTCGKVPTLELVTRKPIVPTEAEQEENPRSRSAKLRIARKIAE